MSTATGKTRHRERRLGNRRAEEGSSRDASEEDNDNDVSDVGSLISVHAPHSTTSTASSSPRTALTSTLPLHASVSSLPPSITAKRAAAAAKRVEELGGDGSEGMDSPTYDGDVESSSTVGGTPIYSSFPHNHGMGLAAGHIRRPSSPTPTPLATSSTVTASNTQTLSPYNKVPTPKASRANLRDPSPSDRVAAETSHPTDVPVGHSEVLSPPRKSQIHPLSAKPSSSALGPLRMTSRPKELPEEDIRAFVQHAIDGTGEENDGIQRDWKTAPPPKDRPVRIYADGVYDLFHFGHALQLRQAKLSFPNVHLLVGVCSDKLCADHKSAPAMTHAERCESVRHCRWADEVLPDAPWVVDQNWLDKHEIDYIAHDEEVYPSAGHKDVYGFAKEQGKFVPTRRTPAISTSDLLERIVRGYRDGFFDSKLEKNGLMELMAEDVDWDSSASVERRERRKKKIQTLGLASGQSTPP